MLVVVAVYHVIFLLVFLGALEPREIPSGRLLLGLFMGFLQDFRKIVELDDTDTDAEIQLVRFAFKHLISIHKHIDGLVSELVSQRFKLFLDHLASDLYRFLFLSLKIIDNYALCLSCLEEVQPLALRLLILCCDYLDLVTGLKNI